MLIVAFSVLVAMFATAGTFISIEAKRRNDDSAVRPMQASSARAQQTIPDRK
jgi:hypothetical protein